MKHLTTYKLFESPDLSLENDELELSVKDILADVEDDGFEALTFITKYSVDVNIYKPDYRGGDSKYNKLEKHYMFDYSEVKNVILHLTSFLEEKGFSIVHSSMYPSRSLSGSIDFNVNMSGDKSLRLIKLSYVKSLYRI